MLTYFAFYLYKLVDNKASQFGHMQTNVTPGDSTI